MIVLQAYAVLMSLALPIGISALVASARSERDAVWLQE